MKKVLLLAVAGIFVLASCKKDRTCECTIAGKTTGKDKVYVKVTKKWMKENADCVSTETTTEGVTTKRECVIK